jgi:hypothetical protein
MQQQWEAFWARVSELGHQALSPFRAAAEALGYFPSDIQIWCFLCALFISALVVPRSYGDLVLRRRRALATGTVVAIDTSGDGPYIPTIEFRDASGKVTRFDSDLPVNLVTEAIGAQVEVMYDPLHPTRARETGRPFSKAFNTILWYSIIAVLLAMAFCFK